MNTPQPVLQSYSASPKLSSTLRARWPLAIIDVLFIAVLVLIALQFFALFTAAEQQVKSGGVAIKLWLFTSLTALAISILLIWMRKIIAREAARAEAIAEYLSDGLLIIEAGTAIYANAPGLRILGASAIPASLKAELLETLDQARLSHAPILYEPVIDGCPHHFLVTRASLPDKTTREIFIFQDVTFLHENEEAKVSFIGALSHEIKTPVTSLAMALAMLDRTGYDADLVRIANADVSRLRILLDDLLNASKLKIVRNPSALNKRDTNLSALLHQTLKTAMVLAEQKEIRIENHSTMRGQVLANIDATKITWVLSTLMTDAVRQTPNGARIIVALALEGTQAIFEVRYRRRFDSLGPTGHAIVRDIIEAHAGRFVSVHKPEQESLFRFSIHAYMHGANGAYAARGTGKNEANFTSR